jgi:hypothetical protein
MSSIVSIAAKAIAASSFMLFPNNKLLLPTTSLQQAAANGMEVDDEHCSWILIAIVTHNSNDSGDRAVARKCGD